MTNDTKGKRKAKLPGNDRSAADALAGSFEGIPAGLTGSGEDRRSSSFVGSGEDR